MKAFLLAGGKGSRISRYIENVPKSTLPIHGIPLINRTVNLFRERKIPTIVCTGYQEELVQNAISNPNNIKFFHNPFFDITNSISTLWFAKEELNDDCIIMNADVFCDERIIDLIISSPYEIAVASDKTKVETGDYFFNLSENMNVQLYGKELPLEIRSCEYVGLAKVSTKKLDYFNKMLNKLINQQKHNLWWENVLYTMADEGEEIHAVDVNGLFWEEIDYYDDYERIVNHLQIVSNEITV